MPDPASRIIRSALIVDDNDADREWCEIIFKKTERFAFVFGVSSGMEALQLFEDYEESRTRYRDRFPPVVVLLDINMPGMDGFEFLERFAKLRAAVRGKGAVPSVVVMVTSSTDPRDRERAAQFGAGLVTKPLTEQQAVDIADQLSAS